MQFSDSSFFPSTSLLAYCKPNPNTDSAQEAYEQVTERRSPEEIPRGQSFGQQHFKWRLADNGLQRCRWVWQAATRTDKVQGARFRE